MNPTRTQALVGLSLVVSLVVGFGLGRYHGASEPGATTIQAQEGMEGMPGMDMAGGAGAGSIRLSSEQVATFGITFGEAAVRPVSKVVRTVGLVDFDETRMTYVSPKFGGWAERLFVDFSGQVVRRGQALLEVYAPELVTAQEDLLLAARMADSLASARVEGVAADADNLLGAARRRLEYWDISEEQISGLIETGRIRRTLTLHAPASGIVMEKRVIEGQAFNMGEQLYMIADLSEVWVGAEIFEADVALVREGMPAEISLQSMPGRVFRGRIEYVYPTLQDRTRALRARVALPNPEGLLKPGMYATVRLEADLGERLTVPASAVLHSGERTVVFVDMGEEGLMPHEVTVGVRGSDYVEILDGVAVGHRVVTAAQFLLDSESNLAEVMRAMMAQLNMSDMGDMDMDGGR